MKNDDQWEVGCAFLNRAAAPQRRLAGVPHSCSAPLGKATRLGRAVASPTFQRYEADAEARADPR